MSESRRPLDEVLRSVASLDMEAVELYRKQGRSRRTSLGAHGRSSSLHRESGWAVRATGRNSSFFCCGSGDLGSSLRWPQPDGFPIRLPAGRPPGDWREPPDLRAPLVVEHEAFELLQACDRELARELPGARLLTVVLEDGESDAEISSSLGVAAEVRGRAATLYLEAAIDSFRVVEHRGARHFRAFNPRSLGRRLADRLLLRREGGGGQRDRGTVLLAPPVAARILGALLPLFLEADDDRLPEWARRGGSLGSEALGIVDDGRLPNGPAASPVDGEGLPTGRTVLVERGRFRSGLLDWWKRGDGAGAPGCARRESYRDVPRVGPSHLFIEPDSGCSVKSLLDAVARGYYLLELLDPVRFDLGGDYFEAGVAGYAVRNGAPTGRISGALLSGKISRLLKGVQAVARDLTFFPLGGLLGSPSVLIQGAELNRPPRPRAGRPT